MIRGGLDSAKYEAMGKAGAIITCTRDSFMIRSYHHVKDQWWVTRIRSRMFVSNKPQLDKLGFAEIERKM
jgi:hypothetical protein